MFTILIQEKGGEQRRMVFSKPEVTIGRVQGNDIVLPKGNVSKRHARIVLKDGKFIIVDLKSTNGTYVNGRKITSPLVVKDSDKIYIGDFIVGVDETAAGAESEGPSETTNPPVSDRLSAAGPDLRPPRPTEAQPMAAMPIPMSRPDMPRPEAPEPSAPPPVAPVAVRPQPPRPAPGPTRDLPPEPRAIPPIGSTPDPGRTRPPLTARPPGGTLPPAGMAPIPAPVAPAHLDAPTPMPAPTPIPPSGTAAPIVSVSTPPSLGSSPTSAPAAVVPFADKSKGRQLVGAGAKRVTARAVAVPTRRGVHIEPLDPKVQKMLDLQSTILERLRTKLDLDKIPFERLHEEDLWQRAERATIDFVESLETSGELPKYIDQDALIKETLSEALALGPLEDLLADDKVDEIVIDRRDRVIVGKDGQLRGSGKAFSSDEVFERVVKRLVAEAGAQIDDTRPIVDLRMRDGTRLTAAVSPVAGRGACLVLKKPATPAPQLAELATQGVMSTAMADFLATCVTARRNILVCGALGSGKTTIVGALASAAPPGERVISVEDVGELSLSREEWVQLETRVGVGSHANVDLATLIETALRLSPDRLVVGEVRGREALPLVQALNSSVDGAVVAMTGEGGTTTLARLATLARQGGANDAAIRELVAQAFEIVVHASRWIDGSVKVLAIEEVASYGETGFETTVLFQYRDGGFHPTGSVPRFYSELEARGIPADQAVFR